MAVESFLKNIPFFERLSEEQLQDLVEIAGTESWGVNRTVFAEGDPPGNLYLILEGKVKISKKNEAGELLTLATLAKGDFFGEMALVDGAPRAATVSTLAPCEFFVLRRDAFTQLLSQSPRLIPGVFASIVSKLRSVNEKFLLEVVEKQKLHVEMERERQRALAQIGAICNEANTIEQAMQVAVDQVCAYLGWPVGHVYALSKDSEDDLFSLSVWHLKNPERLEPFQKLSEMTRFSAGVGLPGRVLISGKPVWIEDIAQDPNFPRAKVAGECGLRAAFGIPVLAGKRVAAVLEFFCEERKEPDRLLLDAMAHVGNQLGRVIERNQYEERILHSAFHDPLTDLPNRALFLDRLRLSLARAKRDKDYLFAVVFLDLDRFKVINDSLGHLIGDQLLVEVSQRLQTCARAVDTVARLGGDEFVILLEDVQHWSNIPRVVERIRKKLQAPVRLNEREVPASASIGIALSSPDYEHAEELLRDADTAMYRAKAQGLGRHEIFEPQMHQEAVQVLHLQSELQRALEQQQLQLHYQPVVSLDAGQIIGFEALLRWRHPERGLLAAGEFLPVAEETELIVPITEWVLQETCRQAQRWQAQFPVSPPLSVNVNLPAKYLAKQNLATEILALVVKYGVNPSSLRLEITEDQIIRNPELVLQLLHRLSEAGIQILIDDFGTGYSSLAYLSRLRVHGLKIDRSFVQNLHSTKNAAIVQSIVSLGDNLGLNVIAEGVETAEQLDYVREANCPYVQGYYFSRPVDQDAATRLYQEGVQVGSKKKVEPSRLRAFEMFAGLSEEALAEISDGFEELTAHPATLLIRQGKVGKVVYLLEEGVVGIYRGVPDAGGELIAELRAPTVFGERTLLDPERIGTVSVKAITKLRVLTTPITAFLLFLRPYPSLQQKVRAVAAGRS
ncbi:MAG: EAL domain-containing protein [Acidobacteria bacterium]|nr:EAL domain-containing protein [Acidobacteriota bacterium]